MASVGDAVASFGFITPRLIRAGKKLRWVQQPSAGVEHLMEIPELVEGDIVLTNMQRAYAPEIADQALGYLLAFTRDLGYFIRSQTDRRWPSTAKGGRPGRARGQNAADHRPRRHRQRDRPPRLRLRDAGAGDRPQGPGTAPVRRGAASARGVPRLDSASGRRRQCRSAHEAVEEDDRRQGIRR